MKDYLLSKTHVFASINVVGWLVSLFVENPISFIAGSMAIIAGAFNIALSVYKWKHRTDK